MSKVPDPIEPITDKDEQVKYLVSKMVELQKELMEKNREIVLLQKQLHDETLSRRSPGMLSVETNGCELIKVETVEPSEDS